MKSTVSIIIMLIGICFVTIVTVEWAKSLVNFPEISMWKIYHFHTIVNVVLLGLFALFATYIDNCIKQYTNRRTPGKRSQAPEGKVTWNSLTSEQKQRAVDIFGHTLVNDFSRTKGGHYPLHAAISYCIFYSTVATEYKSMTEHDATRLSLLYVDMILGFEEVSKRKLEEHSQEKIKQTFLKAKEDLEAVIHKYQKHKK